MGAQILVLWDVDHTLMETGGVGFDLFRQAFEAVTGQPLQHPAEVTGRTEHAIFQETVQLHHIPSTAALFDRYAETLAAGYEASKAHLAQRGRALPGAAKAIAAVAQNSTMVQSVLTGNLRPVAKTKLRTFGLDEGIDLDVGAYGTDADVRAGLVPVARDRAAAKYQTPFSPGATVLIGDTPSDVQAARESGVRIVGVATGNSTAEDLRHSGAPVVLPNLQDTRAVIHVIEDVTRRASYGERGRCRRAGVSPPCGR